MSGHADDATMDERATARDGVCQLCRRTAFAFPLLMSIYTVAFAAAQNLTNDVLLPANREFLERLALTRARTRLLESVFDLSLDADTTIGQWAAQTVSRERKLRAWLRAVQRSGSTRLFSDASADADVCVTPAQLSAELLELCSSGETTASTVTPETIRAAAGRWLDVWGGGSAFLSEYTEETKPLGWEDVSAEGVALAGQAAAADAVHALMEQAGTLRVTAAKRLKAFLDADGIREPACAAVQTAAKVTIETPPDQIAVARVEIGMTDFIRILTDVHQAHYRGADFHAPDFSEMALNASEQRLEAIGLAVPPERCRLSAPLPRIALKIPEWANATMTVTCRRAPRPDEQIAPADLFEQARADAGAALRRKAFALEIRRGVTLEQFLGYHPESQDDVAAFLSGARICDLPRTGEGEAASVRGELPLARLWRIVARYLEENKNNPSQPAERRETDLEDQP